ncbi:hypothetical protein [Cochleicola gelatinilyticus]|uniref:Adenylosuccinate lyase n=1 Tax=Cochleicola gelatinilyticus TaxID=1763537 RepID=A0A167HR91_9FLAO|nr:hypothetical protein [Cochleicola gelatinilyticus]OAB78880.1 hypothetical protein ULVI_09880 [Cochleicola gelatinilyticus]
MNTSEALLKKLQYTKAYRQTRLDVANWVIDHPETFHTLITYCFKDPSDIAYKAAWILEFVCAKQLDLLLPHLDFYFKNLPKIKRDQSLRPLAKICEMLAIDYYINKDKNVMEALTVVHRDAMTECCFDWLITNQKVACQVYAMESLYYLGLEFTWIHPELKIIIEQHIHTSSAAYKVRGKRILKKLF